MSVSLNGSGKKLLSTHHTLKVHLAVTENGKGLASRTLSFTAPKKKKS